MEAHGEPEPTERDSTDEWRIAPARSLISIAELEGRIDVALATARSAEAAALEIGAASLDAADQARRAAGLAEKASASAARAAESAREATVRSIRSAPSALVADAPVTDAPVGTIDVTEPLAAEIEPEGPEPAAVAEPRAAAAAPSPVAEPSAAVSSAAAAPSPAVEPPAAAPSPTTEPPTVAPTPLDLTRASANGAVPRGQDAFEDRITAFRLRAEKVMIRLQKIEAGGPPHEPTEVVRIGG
jgi:hypothetical protein